MSLVDTAVSRWLSSKHVKVLPEWTEACVEWIHNEYQDRALPDEQLKGIVYEQWLESDLVEIATPSLPQGLAQQNKATIQGSFALQINSIQDVGSSAYSQLIKIKGKENENVGVSATQATQSRFEPKPTRMLMMEVTDGHQKLQAMEYQPIPALTPDTLPGTKILIQGSIMCRLGVLTLTARDVKVLGGEVEDLVEKNSQEQLLARLLGTSLNDLPQQSVRRQPMDDQVPNQPNQGISQPEQRKNERNNLQERLGNQWQSNNSQQKNNQGFVSNIQQSTGMGRQSSNTYESKNKRMQSNSFQQSTNAQSRQSDSLQAKQEWMDDPDEDDLNAIDEDILREFEEAQYQEISKKKVKDEKKVKQEWMDDPDGEAKFEDDLDAIDEDILREFEEAQYQEISKKDVKDEKKSKPPPDWPSDDDTDEEMLAAMIDKLEEQINARDKDPKKGSKIGGSKGPQRMNAKPKTSKINTVKRSSNNAANTGTSNSTQKQTSISNFLKPRGRKEDSTQQSSDVVAIGTKNDKLPPCKLSLKNRSNSTSQFMGSRKQLLPTDDKRLPPEKDTNLDKKHQSSLPKIKQPSGVFIKEETNKKFTTAEPSVKFQSHEQMMGVLGASSATSPHHPKVAIATRIAIEDNPEMVAKRRRLSSGKDSKEDAPFRYLAEMMDSIMAPQKPVTFDIRGFIMTLLSPLGKKNDQWSLEVRLNDGSASLDATLSDEVLQSLVGYSVTEMKQMRLAVNNDEAKTAVVMKQKNALERCRKRLIDLCEIMTVKVAPGDMPTVIRIRRVEKRDCQKMKQCLLR